MSFWDLVASRGGVLSPQTRVEVARSGLHLFPVVELQRVPMLAQLPCEPPACWQIALSRSLETLLDSHADAQCNTSASAHRHARQCTAVTLSGAGRFPWST